MQVATMTDQAIATALAVPVADSPVVRTVAGAFDTYALAVERQVERAGGVPSPLRLSTPANAAEHAALRLFLAELRRAGAHAKIRLV